MNRATWSELLPIIQAFVDGKQIQQLGYDHRWKDTDHLYQVLHSKYRIKVENDPEGIWSIDFTYKEPGKVSGPIATGTLTWIGKQSDDPSWPKVPGFELNLLTLKFEENK